jgi:hypothetical protein
MPLSEVLSRFEYLQHLDMSDNPKLQVLPGPLLRVASRLLTFKCDGCSLVLPPQRMFSSPERNPGVIQEILGGKLDLSSSALTPSKLHLATTFLPSYPHLYHLDVSNNPTLGSAGVALVLSSFSGMNPDLHCICLFIPIQWQVPNLKH